MNIQYDEAFFKHKAYSIIYDSLGSKACKYQDDQNFIAKCLSSNVLASKGILV